MDLPKNHPLDFPSPRSRFTEFFRELIRKPSSALGTLFVGVFLLLAVFGPLVAPYGANEQIAEDAGQPPSNSHWFGTDQLGRDVYSRVVLGAREVVTLAGVGTLLAVFLGTAFGLISGYLGGLFDEILMRTFDSLLALPALLIALVILGTFGPSEVGILLVLMVVYTPIVARVVRSVVLVTKTMAYVDAARLQGERVFNILLREILPSTIPALAVEASLRFSYAIFLVSSLGFLGVGVQPPSPDWGRMVKEARAVVTQFPWALYFPAGAIGMIVVSVNLMADGVRRALRRA